MDVLIEDKQLIMILALIHDDLLSQVF